MNIKSIVLIVVSLFALCQTLCAGNNHVMDAQEQTLQDYSIHGIDFSFINNIPKVALNISIEAKETSSDSTPDIANKRRRYFSKLMGIEKELIDRYYFHDEMKLSQLDSISNLAELKANLRYPMAFSAGNSMHDYYVDTEQIRTIREIILFTVKELYRVLSRAKPKGEKLKDFETWINEWKRSDLVQ